jgi:2-methylisocitrate lyase-like PEP mutase family enzyme
VNVSALAAQAEQLRGLHVPGSPLLLVNAWDPPSARRLAHDGYPADLEAGYGLQPRELVDGLLRAGAVGLNFEDSDHEGGGLTDAERQSERLARLKQAGRDAGVDIVLNARVDVFLRDGELDEAVRRGRLYAQAGADCIYPIGVRGRDAIRRLVEEVGAPLNVLVMLGGLTFGELAELGVARVSFGSGLMHAAMDAAAARVEDFLAS